MLVENLTETTHKPSPSGSEWLQPSPPPPAPPPPRPPPPPPPPPFEIEGHSIHLSVQAWP